MTKKLLVFDSHPVQYRVPIWQTMESLNKGSVHVVYGSDCSVRGHADEGFGRTIAWDEPLLSGYANTVLNCEKGTPLKGWNSITGKGVNQLIEKLKPSVILLTGLNYRYDLKAYLQGNLKGIPIWLRCETQDQAGHRSKLKSIIRSIIYRVAYLSLARVFFIGELNKTHYLKHGVNRLRLKAALYGTVDRFASMENQEKEQLRVKARITAGIPPLDFVVGFSGKLITKKNPEILFQMLEFLPEDLRRRTNLYFLGSGELEKNLRLLADNALRQFGIKSFFAGFVNQSQLAPHYLAMDVMILPSRRMGETWGLVANEAMQSGCGVIVSDAVGCSADFVSWERFRVFREGDPVQLSEHVIDLSKFPREFEWAMQGLKCYSIEATANSLLEELEAC